MIVTSIIISTPMMTGMVVVILEYTVVTEVEELPYLTGVAETGYEIGPPVPVVRFGRQVPFPDGFPLRHLQLEEQGSPGVPLGFPSSHSSPIPGSQVPLPQPTGVAPRLMIYGMPTLPSPKVSLPCPVIFCAMARASKPLTPVDGYEVKAS